MVVAQVALVGSLVFVVAGGARDHGDGLSHCDDFTLGDRAVAAGTLGDCVDFVGEPDEFG